MHTETASGSVATTDFTSTPETKSSPRPICEYSDTATLGTGSPCPAVSDAAMTGSPASNLAPSFSSQTCVPQRSGCEAKRCGSFGRASATPLNVSCFRRLISAQTGPSGKNRNLRKLCDPSATTKARTNRCRPPFAVRSTTASINFATRPSSSKTTTFISCMRSRENRGLRSLAFKIASLQTGQRAYAPRRVGGPGRLQIKTSMRNQAQ